MVQFREDRAFEAHLLTTTAVLRVASWSSLRAPKWAGHHGFQPLGSLWGTSSTELLLDTGDRGRSDRDEAGSVRAIFSLAWPGGLRDKPGEGGEDGEGEGKPYLTFVPGDTAWMLPQLFPRLVSYWCPFTIRR